MSNLGWSAPVLFVLVAATLGLAHLRSLKSREWYDEKVVPPFRILLELSVCTGTVLSILATLVFRHHGLLLQLFATAGFYAMGVESAQAFVTDRRFRKLDARLLNPLVMFVVVSSSVVVGLQRSWPILAMVLVVSLGFAMMGNMGSGVGTADAKVLILLWCVGAPLLGTSKTAAILAGAIVVGWVWSWAVLRRNPQSSTPATVPLAWLLLVIFPVASLGIDVIVQNFGKLPNM